MKSKEGESSLSPANSKRCTKCGNVKPRSAFALNNSNRDGRRAMCKDCHNAYMRAYHAKKLEELGEKEFRARQKINRLAVRYGITPEQLDQMKEERNWRCDCCGKDCPRTPHGLHVDHCHDTGFIRGLVCSECNNGIGKLGDNLQGVMDAVRYLHQAHIRQANAA